MSVRPFVVSLATTALALTMLTGCTGEVGDPATVDSTTSATPGTASGVTPVSLTYSVGGMTCEACVSNVTKGVSAIAGVSGCQVDLEAGRMVVQVDSPETGAKIAAAVENMQYTIVALPAEAADGDADGTDPSVAGG